jgi:hypothetical protein
MDPRLYLALAKALVARVKSNDGLVSAGGQAECRCAISRAYYAAYLVAVSLLGFLRINVADNGLCHTVTKNGLNNSGDNDLVTASSHLGTLYTDRRRADYKMNHASAGTVMQAEAMVDLADETITLLDKYQRECGTAPGKGLSAAKAILAWANLSGQGQNLFKKP